MAKSVFFSFHYERDVSRVQLVRNIGALEGQPLLNAQKWEDVKRGGDTAIKKWIADQMAHKSAVVVLAGAQTASRRWVQYEIEYAWEHKKPLVGIAIHGLAGFSGRPDSAGANPFSMVGWPNGTTLANYVPFYTPRGWDSQAVYADIKNNLTTWVASAYRNG